MIQQTQEVLKRTLSEWYLVSRYPGLEEVALAASDVMAALNLVSDFMTVVRGYGPPDRP